MPNSIARQTACVRLKAASLKLAAPHHHFKIVKKK
jgi:hypothetical protein